MNQVVDEINRNDNFVDDTIATTNVGTIVVDQEPIPPMVEIAPVIVADSKAITPSKKRKSSIVLNDDEDQGSTCSICLDDWELAGSHRLTSLKCGHLFGYGCIKRWMEENSPRNRLCPRCKKRATQRDFRFIYPKRVTASDNSEEVRLREQLQMEREKSIKLEVEYTLNLKFEQDKCIDLQERLSDLQQILASYNDTSSSSGLRIPSSQEPE